MGYFQTSDSHETILLSGRIRDMAKQKTLVKKYKGEKRYQKDANKLAQQGYRVVSVTDQGKPGWRWLVGPVWVKRRLLVTYAKDV